MSNPFPMVRKEIWRKAARAAGMGLVVDYPYCLSGEAVDPSFMAKSVG